jgi:hypothetical protein
MVLPSISDPDETVMAPPPFPSRRTEFPLKVLLATLAVAVALLIAELSMPPDTEPTLPLKVLLVNVSVAVALLNAWLEMPAASAAELPLTVLSLTTVAALPEALSPKLEIPPPLLFPELPLNVLLLTCSVAAPALPWLKMPPPKRAKLPPIIQLSTVSSESSL